MRLINSKPIHLFKDIYYLAIILIASKSNPIRYNNFNMGYYTYDGYTN